MANGVFTTKLVSAYDDAPWERYHFPRTYLRQAEVCLGDWILYYEPRRRTTEGSSRGGRQAYVAMARVVQIVPDARVPDHFYALVDGYLPFERPVPFLREDGGRWERALQKQDGSTNKGAFGRAVRGLSREEFEPIVRAGFPLVARGDDPDAWIEAQAVEETPEERPIVEAVTRRLFRDRLFALSVRRAWDRRCALTGLQLVNGGNRPEVEAAHIQPVAARGPDLVTNGLALSRTAHWAFDRGLVSLEDDGRILLARRGIEDELRRLLRPEGRVPLELLTPELRPDPRFLRFHREVVFKG